ncbi:MAG: GDP-mannose 4,6-dehydratase [Anaerolineaceae bacterium]|nr:GDP-mannose 4,6-dehydratase [Anaerolineaceae bacterium]
MANNILITGGAGFIGSNFARRHILLGDNVTIFDNLSRKGATENLSWIKAQAPERKFQFIQGDVRDFGSLQEVVKEKDIIIHLAAQVAVTSSVTDPYNDFRINAEGTFNILETVRRGGNKPLVIFASTNKVYGEIKDVAVVEEKTRYAFNNLPFGISENQLLDFHSPYGCSKGCGDQYVRDFARIYGIPSVVFRQSCIYGIRQFGVEDQGWLAWFVIAAVLGKPITIYGDGKQVRDVLFIDDLMDAYDLAIENKNKAYGWIFNIGGGIDNSISIWREFGPILENIHGNKINVNYKNWRPGDQKIYISDISKIKKEFGWSPKISVKSGIARLYKWVVKNKHLFD